MTYAAGFYPCVGGCPASGCESVCILNSFGPGAIPALGSVGRGAGCRRAGGECPDLLEIAQVPGEGEFLFFLVPGMLRGLWAGNAPAAGWND